MRFTDPIWLLLLIPAGLGLAYSFRHIHGMAKGRKRWAFAVRFLLVALLIVALSGPESRRSNCLATFWSISKTQAPATNTV